MSVRYVPGSPSHVGTQYQDHASINGIPHEMGHLEPISTSHTRSTLISLAEPHDWHRILLTVTHVFLASFGATRTTGENQMLYYQK
jgi:hypothetical protein